MFKILDFQQKSQLVEMFRVTLCTQWTKFTSS